MAKSRNVTNVTRERSSGGLSPWIGWGISTLLLLFLNRGNSSSSYEDTQQPSKFTETNGSQIGNPIPVALGRVLIKNPLVAYYGDFRADIYTEEYGMHSDLDAAGIIWSIILGILATVIMVANHPVITNTGGGTATDAENGFKNGIIVNMVLNALATLLLWLFNNHAGRTTIQKGFKYYLGWQHIICWTGSNIGIKRIWMNVYDPDIEESTEQGVWGDDGAAYLWGDGPLLPDSIMLPPPGNRDGICAYIDDDEMFGGVDEGGGFVGSIRIYFGHGNQPKDPWMVRQMTISDGIPQELRGLTPQYPMYLTAVISSKDYQSGAYIGKQATVPEMWFEVHNYPQLLGRNHMKTPEQWSSGKLYNWGDLIHYLGKIYRCILKHVASNMFVDDTEKWKYIQDGGIEPIIPFKQIIGEDANPAEVIYEILTNKIWGCGYNVEENTVDIDSLFLMAYCCEDEELGISCLITDLSTANEYVSKILDHINAIKFDDPVTGKLTFKMIRDDFVVEDLKTFDPSNCTNMEFSRLDWSETTSSISVNFTLAEDKYENAQLNVTDLANIRIKQNYTEKNIDGTYFTEPSNARKMAYTQLLSAAYPLSAVSFESTRYGYDVTIGEPIIVSWAPYGINKQVFRVTDVDYATLTSGAITITAVEDVFAFDKSDYTYGDIPVWTNPEYDPDEIEFYEYFEMPYEMSMSLNTYLRAYAIRPSEPTIYWAVWRFENPDYEQKTESMVWALAGRMTQGYSESYEKDSSGFEFAVLGYDTRLMLEDKIDTINSNPYAYNANSGLNLLVCDGEIMSYDKLSLLPNGRFFVSGIIRGLYDTVPKEHTIESVVYFLDNYQNVSNTFVALQGYYSDESLEITTRGQTSAQSFDINKVDNFRTSRRSECPSIMANLKFGADRGTLTQYEHNYPAGTKFCHNIEFSFFGRNKFNNLNIMTQVDNTVEVASNLKNVVRLECAGEEVEFMFDAYDSQNNRTLESMEISWAEFCKRMTNLNGASYGIEKIAKLNYCTMEVQTYDPTTGLYSFDKYSKDVLWACPSLVGIVTQDSDAQAYADSITMETTVVIPASSVCPQLTYNFEDCCLIFVGEPEPAGYQGEAWLGQDGNRYVLSTRAYRIDGVNMTYNQFNLPVYNAVIHEVTIDEEYIFTSNFNVATGNYIDGIRYRNGEFRTYTLYN